MSGQGIIAAVSPLVQIASDHLAATAHFISKLSDAEYRSLLEELAKQPADETTALISSLCLPESTTRLLKLTPPAHA